MASYSIRDVGIVNKLARAEKDLQELKNRQFVGKKVLATKVSESPLILSSDSWGFGVPVTDPPTQQIFYKNITFTADTQLSPYGRLLIEYYDLAGNQILNDSLDSSAGARIFYYNFIVTYVDDKTLKWNVDIRGPGSPKYYVKLVFAGSDTGSFTWVNA
jgi:hypothetical protein